MIIFAMINYSRLNLAKLAANMGKIFFASLILLFLSGLMNPAIPEELKPFTPPEPGKALYHIPGKDGKVALRLDLDQPKSTDPITVEILKFWSMDNTCFNFKLEGSDEKADGLSTTIQTGQPLILLTEGFTEGQLVWGTIFATQGKKKVALHLVLGSSGPEVIGETPFSVDDSGKVKLSVDMSQHKNFGDRDEVSFEVKLFKTGEQTTTLPILDTTIKNKPKEKDKVTASILDTREKDKDTTPMPDIILLEIDASSLAASKIFTASLQTKIGKNEFIDTKFNLKMPKPETEVLINQIVAVIILVFSVIFSFIVTKWLVTAVKRRNLRLRIADIKKKSWLRNDRWGALPIVRAFARIALANKVMFSKHKILNNPMKSFFTNLHRKVTAPQLITDEVTEVEERLNVLVRLNELAIYWRTAPSSNGVRVSGVDDTIRKRAQKILRRIVDRFSQLQDGEEIGELIISEIAALEGWQQRDLMKEGYWAHLSGDIHLLLDSVQLCHFSFDSKANLRLEGELKNFYDAADDNQKQKLKAAISACKVAENEGVGAIRTALADGEYSDEIEAELKNLELCDRETVRHLQLEINPESTPESLNRMIWVEGKYTRLKLVWEQRDDEKRQKGLIRDINNGKSLSDILKEVDNKAWELLTKEGVMKIMPPKKSGKVEAFEPTDFEIKCTDNKAKTFLFKHGLEYEWTFSREKGSKALTAITQSTVVTQFIPAVTDVVVSVIVRRGDEEFKDVKKLEFTTVKTSRFNYLWAIGTPEMIATGIALILALIAGSQTDPFEQIINGGWNLDEGAKLFSWGIAADQVKNIVKNIDSITKGDGAVST